MLTVISTIKQIAAVIAAIIGLFRDGISAWDRQQERDAGKAEANAATQAQSAERVQQGHAAGVEADRDHAAHPDGDDGFDTDFRRKD